MRRAHGRRPSLFGISIPFFEPRAIPPSARIHRSVIERAAAKGGLPRNVAPDPVVEG